VSGTVVDMVIVCNAVTEAKLVSGIFSGVLREESTLVIRCTGELGKIYAY
jgi:hypothetical protein